MKTKLLIVVFFVLAAFSGFTQVKVGEWKDHRGFNSTNSVAKVGDVVYASNGTGLLKYTISDGSTEVISKINGLSDIGITLLRYNPYNNTLLIVYNNANIDVLKGDVFTNFSDIKRKTITGKKNINEVTFKNNIAYLACGFGIVVFDTDKIEVKDTYYIGPGGSYLNVYQVETTDSTIIAATTSGLYRANKSTVLNNYQNWSVISSVPFGTYNGVVKYGNKLMANYSPWAASTTQWKDTLYSYDGTFWQKDVMKAFPYSIKRLLPNNNYFACLDQYGLEIFPPGGGVHLDYITGYPSGYAVMGDAFVDASKPQFWIADLARGFIKSEGLFSPNTQININGTHGNFVSSIDVFDGRLISTPSKIEVTGYAPGSREGMNYYHENDWQYWKEPVDTVVDYCYAIIDRKDPSRTWVSSWVQGLCEFRDGQLQKVYNHVNSVIPYVQPFAYFHRCAGLSMDEAGNLWIGASDVQNFLSVRKANGTFQNFSFGAGIPFVGRILADKNNQIWVTFPRSASVIGQLAQYNNINYATACGIAVYQNNNFGTPNAGNTKFLTLSEGQGKLPDPYVFAIAEDKEGQIWVGTTKGIAVFYNPENIFSGSNYDAQQILITQDNHVQILLETEKVTAIAVDAANRKWVGTEASGIYCFSPDGQQEIYHFTADNSPLYSNTIIDIAYDDKSGDVFFGSDQGIQSYRSEIVKGEEDCSTIHAFPNPVKPGYNENVYVRGLMNETVIKITDINSNLVWETKSLGGQVAWGLKNLQGRKVAPGVYMATASLSDGTVYCMTKILVLN
jgi:hypothetical protein